MGFVPQVENSAPNPLPNSRIELIFLPFVEALKFVQNRELRSPKVMPVIGMSAESNLLYSKMMIKTEIWKLYLQANFTHKIGWETSAGQLTQINIIQWYLVTKWCKRTLEHK